MAIVKYHASGHFDIDTEVEVSDNEVTDNLAVWLAIVGDLESRYGLAINILEGEKQQ